MNLVHCPACGTVYVAGTVYCAHEECRSPDTGQPGRVYPLPKEGEDEQEENREG